MCIGQTPKDLPVGYVNDDVNGYGLALGKEIIDEMNNATISKIKYSSFEEGMRDLRKGDLWCLFKIDKNFSLEIINAYMNKNQKSKKFEDYIHVYMDNTSKV